MNSQDASARFGQHWRDVLEVVEVVRSGRILNGVVEPRLLSDPKIFVVHAAKGLERFRAENPVDPDALTWFELRQQDAAKHQSFCPNARYFYETIQPHLTVELHRMEALLLARLGVLLGEEELFEMVSQIDIAMNLRASNGKQPDSLAETLFQFLKAGGYGCGWKGPMEGGKLVVTCPPFE